MSNIVIKNKKAHHQYFIEEDFLAGIQLMGTEIKSIRAGKASLADAYCHFDRGELYVHMHITAYSHGGAFNHEPRRERKLLLTRRELKKLEGKVATKGQTIVPLKLFVNERGLAKIKIALARGKKMYDKRHDLKEKDMKRDVSRYIR